MGQGQEPEGVAEPEIHGNMGKLWGYGVPYAGHGKPVEGTNPIRSIRLEAYGSYARVSYFYRNTMELSG
jgi:hypothetical protein